MTMARLSPMRISLLQIMTLAFVTSVHPQAHRVQELTEA
jgi:hypothetical protein